jgi:hypothetical protein
MPCFCLQAPTRTHATFFDFPWDKKIDKAIWRGTRWCDGGVPQKHVGVAAVLPVSLLVTTSPHHCSHAVMQSFGQ